MKRLVLVFLGNKLRKVTFSLSTNHEIALNRARNLELEGKYILTL